MLNLPIYIITGLSGSGKSTAIAVLEDAGFYCVDNMPVVLLPKFLELPMEIASDITGLAFVMDLREKDFLSKHSIIFEDLKQKGYNLTILFLEADEAILLRRFSQTRRPHPLSKNKSLIEGIRAEKSQLENMRSFSDRIIDTSHTNVHELKAMMLSIIKGNLKTGTMRIHILSFGFKNGMPTDADLVVDVRFLINPYFVPELKHLNGEAGEVADYILKNEESRLFIKKYIELLDYLIPLYEKEGKAYLTIAFGCTGGQHRSVVVAQKIFEHISQKGISANIIHRDIDR